MNFANKGHSSQPGEWKFRDTRNQGFNWKTQQFPSLACEGKNVQGFLCPGSLPGSTQLKLLFCGSIMIKLFYGPRCLRLLNSGSSHKGIVVCLCECGVCREPAGHPVGSLELSAAKGVSPSSGGGECDCHSGSWMVRHGSSLNAKQW